MECPACQHADSRVVDSRESGDSVRRRRVCQSCGHRFTTFERVDYRLPMVVKRDGRRQTFSEDKLLAGLRLACRKRPVSHEQLMDVVQHVARELSRRPDREVATQEIGDLALAELFRLDHVAYIRFASVYRAFETAEDFLEVMKPLLQRP